MGFSVGGYVCMQGDTKAAATFVSNCWFEWWWSSHLGRVCDLSCKLKVESWTSQKKFEIEAWLSCSHDFHGLSAIPRIAQERFLDNAEQSKYFLNALNMDAREAKGRLIRLVIGIVVTGNEIKTLTKDQGRECVTVLLFVVRLVPTSGHCWMRSCQLRRAAGWCSTSPWLLHKRSIWRP